MAPQTGGPGEQPSLQSRGPWVSTRPQSKAGEHPKQRGNACLIKSIGLLSGGLWTELSPPGKQHISPKGSMHLKNCTRWFRVQLLPSSLLGPLCYWEGSAPNQGGPSLCCPHFPAPHPVFPGSLLCTSPPEKYATSFSGSCFKPCGSVWGGGICEAEWPHLGTQRGEAGGESLHQRGGLLAVTPINIRASGEGSGPLGDGKPGAILY